MVGFVFPMSLVDAVSALAYGMHRAPFQRDFCVQSCRAPQDETITKSIYEQNGSDAFGVCNRAVADIRYAPRYIALYSITTPAASSHTPHCIP